MDANLKKTLEKLGIKGNVQLYYPYILDMDPIKAASYLTIEDGLKAIELISYVYKVLKGEKEPKYTLLEKSLQTPPSFDWFASFYEELVRLNELEEYETVPYDLKPKGLNNYKPYFFPPLSYNTGKVREKKFPPNIKDPIAKYRCLYIKNKVSLSEFREGYPSWYALSDMTLFEEYNVMTNIRVRIDFTNGEFRYFLAGASDNWKEIKEVPLEMDHIISALMFRS